MPESTVPTPSQWLDALAGSHDRLSERVGELDPDGLRRQSYCTEWSVAQVLSHLGSGAEIFKLAVDAVIAGKEPPSTDAFPPIWDRWNAMTPDQQAEEFVAADGALVETLERLGDSLDDFHTVMFGFMEVNASGFLGMRLGEHALHAWDVAVAFDPAATVNPECVALLIDRVPLMSSFMGQAEKAGDDRPYEVRVATTAPVRAMLFAVDESVGAQDVTTGPAAGDGEPDLLLASEALLRLIYGRLDPEHAPAVPAGGQTVALDRLRTVFAPALTD